MRVHDVTTKCGVAASAMLACVAVVAACGNVGAVTELSVGNTPSGDDGGDTDGSLVAAEPDASTTGTFMDQLNAKCAAPAGQADNFSSAAQLTSRLSGRWYHCPSSDPSDWKLPAGTGMAYDFNVAGTWAFLDYSDVGQSFSASTDAARSGQVLYYVFAGTQPEGGPVGDGSAPMDAGAFGSMFIPFNDTVTRNGILLELQCTNADNREFQVVFEQNPRKLQLQELSGSGGDTVTATFVPID